MSYYPYYPTPVLNMLMKLATAIVSLYTSYQLLIVVPRVLYYPIYTQNIEHENLQRQVHERFLEENINIFQQIREFTQTLSGQPLQNLYNQIVLILHKQLKINTALYMKNGPKFILISKAPADLVCPDSISCINDESENLGFSGYWKLHPFNGGDDDHLGCIALETVQVSHITTGRNMQFDHEEDSLLRLTDATVSINMTDQPYCDDIILDIVEHFESNLVQALAKEKNDGLIVALTKQNEALKRSRFENQELAKESRDWLSVMSHEMRTPLFAILSLSELILAKKDNTDKESYASLQLIQSSAQHLSEIINNVLDFSKLEEKGQYHLDDTVTFNIRDVVSDALSINVRNDRRMYPRTCMSFSDSVPQEIIGDALRVKQIILNLVSNSIKFTPDEGYVAVDVDLKLIDQGLGHLNIRVVDTGIGIKPEDRGKIFKEYSQTDATITRKFGGTGLGLSICKRLCKLMDGDIDFEPNEQQGTVFIATISVKIPPQKRNSRICAMELPDSVKAWKVLVVDDLTVSGECTRKHLQNVLGILDVCISETFMGQESKDLYIVNVRSESVIKNQSSFEIFLQQQHDRVILQGNPYVKQILTCSSSYEILGPVIPRELCDMVKSIAETAGLLKLVHHDTSASQDLKLHVLVAEDNAINQTVLRKMLAKMKVTADFADNGHIALAKYSESPDKYRIILMDIMMPVMDGYSASKAIRKLSASPKIPYIIALTANAFWEDKVKAMEAGMNDFVTKPANFKSLYDALVKATS